MESAILDAYPFLLFTNAPTKELLNTYLIITIGVLKYSLEIEKWEEDFYWFLWGSVFFDSDLHDVIE